MKGNNEEQKEKRKYANRLIIPQKRKENTHMYKDIYGKVTVARLH